jgi:hypothetical protein
MGEGVQIDDKYRWQCSWDEEEESDPDPFVL